MGFLNNYYDRRLSFFLSYYEWRDELYYWVIHSERVFVFKKAFNLMRVFKAQCHTRERGLNTPVSNTCLHLKKMEKQLRGCSVRTAPLYSTKLSVKEARVIRIAVPQCSLLSSTNSSHV